MKRMEKNPLIFGPLPLCDGIMRRGYPAYCADSVHRTKSAMHPGHRPGEIMQADWGDRRRRGAAPPSVKKITSDLKSRK